MQHELCLPRCCRRKRRIKLLCLSRLFEAPVRDRTEMADNGKVHPGCPNAANPYHECFQECYRKMGNPKTPQKVKSFSGVAGTDPARRRNNSQTRKLEKVTSFPYVSTVEPNHDTTIESETNEIDLEEFSFNKGQNKSLLSEPVPVPTSGRDTPAIANSPERRMNGLVAMVAATPLRNGHDNKQVKSRELLASAAAAYQAPERAKHAPLRSTSSSITDPDRQFQESDEDDVQSVISESRITVGKYYVKESMAPILRAILEKYGDIAENCVMESVAMRSCSLECICFVIQELQSTSFTQMTTSKIKEIMTILKDQENLHIRIDWLRRVLTELSDASDMIARHQQHKSEKARIEVSMEEMKKELEALSEDLRMKEREVEEAKALVAGMRDQIRRGEIESSILNEDTASLRPQLESFHFDGLIDELLR